MSDPFAAGLPFGYSSQIAWSFQERSDHAVCEFHRVYGPAVQVDLRGPLSSLDQDLSHWSVVLPGQQTYWWLRYAYARELLGAHLSFEKFSSLAYMQERLPSIFRASLAEPITAPPPPHSA